MVRQVYCHLFYSLLTEEPASNELHAFHFVIRHSCFVILVIAHLWSQNSKIRFLTHWKKLNRKVFSKPSESSQVRKTRASLLPAAKVCSTCAPTTILASPIIPRSSPLQRKRSRRTALEWRACVLFAGRRTFIRSLRLR